MKPPCLSCRLSHVGLSLLFLAGPALASACVPGPAKGADAPAAGVEAEPPSEPPAPPSRSQRTELTVDEASLQTRLAVHIAHLAGKLGARTPERPWELADASDYVARQFEELGYVVDRHGYETGGVLAQNLTVRAGGGERGDQIILVGAHYDSPVGDAGRNGAASATAALLELARLMQGADLKRTIQFTAFALGESPHGDDARRGARVYLQELQARRAKEQAKLAREEARKRSGDLPQELPALPVDQSRFVAMISLGRLLAFRPDAVGHAAPIWVSLRATDRAAPFSGAIAQALDEPPFLVESTTLGLGGADSDAQAFAEADVPVVVVDGSGDAAGDDLDGLTRLVMALRRALAEMAEERPSEAIGLGAP